MNYAITLSGQSYTLSTSDDAQIAAIAACRARYNEALPQEVDGAPNPALIATDAKYLEYVFGHWATGNAGFANADLQAAAANAFASYAGQQPPEQIIESVPLTGDALKSALRAYAAEKRWSVETGGTSVGGFPIKTDETSQRKILGAWAKAKADPSFSIANWKVGAGVYVPLDNATIVAAGDAVLAHIQLCHDAEASVSAAIDAGTITTTAEINAANWS